MRNTLMFTITLSLATTLHAAETEPKLPLDPYLRVHPLPTQPAMTPLPPGQVMPQGWLKDWCETMRDGITGHLDEQDPVFQDAWKGIAYTDKHINFGSNYPNGTKDAGNGGGWPLEQCGYWLDGALRLGLVLHDDKLLTKMSARLDLIVNNVLKKEQDGPITWWNTDWPIGFDSWANAVIGRALVAYYAGTKKPDVLRCLERAYNVLPTKGKAIDCNGLGGRGAQNYESFFEAYTLGANIPFTEKMAMAKFGFGDHHGVTYCENSKTPAILSLTQKNQGLLDASISRLEALEKAHMLPNGLPSGGEYLSGIGAFLQGETCVVSDYQWTALWLYRITGERLWGDRIERTFFNAGPGTLSRDGKLHVYFQAPNRLNEGSRPKDKYSECRTVFRPTHPVLCCSGNVNRFIPNYVMHMWMATADHGLAFTLLGPCRVQTVLQNQVKVELKCETAYPFDEKLSISVNPERATSFPLYLRVPGWCPNPIVSINDQKSEVTIDKNGFIRLEREWKTGDMVHYTIPMTVRLFEGKQTCKMGKTPPNNAPFASLYHGPLLYVLALPELDNDPNKVDPTAKWNFALSWKRNDVSGSFHFERKDMPPRWDWPFAAPVTLTANVVQFDWLPEKVHKWVSMPTESIPADNNKLQKLQLIPYGCAKFRVSMFPVTSP